MRSISALRSVQIAEANVSRATSMQSSALLAAQDARAVFERGDLVAAHRRALGSLDYSLGRFHPVREEVASLS